MTMPVHEVIEAIDADSNFWMLLCELHQSTGFADARTWELLLEGIDARMHTAIEEARQYKLAQEAEVAAAKLRVAVRKQKSRAAKVPVVTQLEVPPSNVVPLRAEPQMSAPAQEVVTSGQCHTPPAELQILADKQRRATVNKRREHAHIVIQETCPDEWLLNLDGSPLADATPAELRWRHSAMFFAGDAASIFAYWDKTFPGWREYKLPSEVAAMVKPALETWIQLAEHFNLTGQANHGQPDTGSHAKSPVAHDTPRRTGQRKV